MDILETIKKKAKKDPKRVVFPEGAEERVLKAVKIMIAENIVKPILISKASEIKKKAKKIGLDLKDINVIDPLKSKKLGLYSKKFYELRKNKGISLGQAKEIMKDENYFGTMMVHLGDADGMVSGAIHPTADTLRPALQIIKTKEKFHRVSGVFFMILKERLLFFADAAVEINPDAKDLAEIAIDTAETAKRFGVVPRIAMLSFSTHGSSKHPLVDKVKEATEIVKYKRPDLIIDGEIQVDAALNPKVTKIKCPNSILRGSANILIFPDLQSGNISYKVEEYLGNANAIGPILQGLKKPVNDLSRGCTVEDIVEVSMITVVEAQRIRS